MKSVQVASSRPNAQQEAPALFFEMLRSFTALAETLNLSEAVRRTGVTRQTLRRHIAALEEMRGEVLFHLDDRRYTLAEGGRRALTGASEILSLGDAWAASLTGHINGLVHLSKANDVGVDYHLQQYGLGRIWETGAPLLQVAFKLWSQSMARIEDPSFQAIRPYLVIFRKVGESWVCVEVGQQSSYASWYGIEWAQSTVGLVTDSLPAGSGFARLLTLPFDEVRISESARYDHIFTEMIREKGGDLIPLAFQRLLLSVQFPNGSRGIASVVERTRNITIDGVSQDIIDRMQPELIMNSFANNL